MIELEKEMRAGDDERRFARRRRLQELERVRETGQLATRRFNAGSIPSLSTNQENKAAARAIPIVARPSRIT